MQYSIAFVSSRSSNAASREMRARLTVRGEIRRRAKSHLGSGDRVFERQLGGVQKNPRRGRAAIEGVAENRKAFSAA